MTAPDAPSPAARWRRLKAVLGDALELPASEQRAFLARHAADTAELSALQDLQAAAHASDSLLDAGPSASMIDAVEARLRGDWVDREVGGYRLVALIARGGMGQVYRARRLDQAAGPEVAIKFMRDGAMGDSLAHRFLAERQTLARLDHPHLAKLLDSGMADGVPYFVMELVLGEPIDIHCRDRALPLAQRIGLFRTLCEVVHYAHGQGVVHRDLKPANVLVTPDGVVKLVDFGIAKALDVDGQTGTATSMRVMTLACASPEQVRGQPITTASDVYSLGVLLYHLLTDRSPYRLDAASDDLDVRKAICETRPVRPSRALVGASRRQVQGDLDAIVMMALHKAPHRRHASAQALSEELRRHLDGLPVQARWRWAWRVGRFARRRRVLAGAAWVAGLAAVSGVALTLHAGSEADRRAMQAHQDLARLRVELRLAIDRQGRFEHPPGRLPAQQPMLRSAPDQLRRLSTDGPPDLGFQAELATAYLHMAQVQGWPGSVDLDDPTGPGPSYAAAVSRFERILQAQPGTRALHLARSGLAQAQADLAPLLARQGRRHEAWAMARRALAEALRLGEADAHGGDTRRLIATTHLVLAQTLPADGSDPDMPAALQSAQAMLALLHEEKPSDLAVTAALAAAQARHGQYLLQADVDTPHSAEQAAAAFRQAMALWTAVLDHHPQALDLKMDRAMAQSQLAEALLRTGQAAEAISHGTQARDAARKTWQADPGHRLLQARFAETSRSLATLLLVAGSADAAVQAASDAAAAFEQLETARPGDRLGLLRHAEARYVLGHALMARAPASQETRGDAMPADWAAACDHFRHSLQRLAPLQPRWQGDSLVPDAARLLEMRQVLLTCPEGREAS